MTGLADERGVRRARSSGSGAPLRVVAAYERAEVDARIARLEARIAELEVDLHQADRRASDAERRAGALGAVESSFVQLFGALQTSTDGALREAQELARQALLEAHQEAEDVRRAAAEDAERIADETRRDLDEEYQRFEARLAAELAGVTAPRDPTPVGAPGREGLDLGLPPRPAFPPLDLADPSARDATAPPADQDGIDASDDPVGQLGSLAAALGAPERLEQPDGRELSG